MWTKKLLAALLSVLIVLMMMPTAVFADGTVTPPTTLIVGGVEVVKDGNVTANVSGTGWSYNHNTATLTLNGATINGVESTERGAGIYSEGGTLTIEFSGNNTITGVVPDVAPERDNSSIAIDAALYGSLIFSGSEGATLTAMGGDLTLFGYGVYAGGGVTVSGGTLEATGGKAEYSCGVRTNGSVTVSGTGKVLAVGGEADLRSYGVYSDSITVSGGTLTANSGEATNSYGVNVNGSVTVSGGTLTAVGGEAANSFGVTVGSSVTVSGGTVTATGGKQHIATECMLMAA